MKVFQPPREDPKKLRAEVNQFGKLLRTHAALSERDDILPFFKKRPNLAAFIGSFVNEVGVVTDYALEYPIFGDFAADLVVEFEDSRRDSVFKTPRGKSTPEWSVRFEHGFSQIVDWFTHIDDLKKTARFQKDFGHGHVRFSALLVIGRDADLTAHDRHRPEWRTEKVRVDSHAVECVTFDGLHTHMDHHLRLTTGY